MKEVFTFKRISKFEIVGPEEALLNAKAELKSLVKSASNWELLPPRRTQRKEDELIAFTRKEDEHAKDCILSIGQFEPNQLKLVSIVSQKKGDVIDQKAFAYVSREFFDCFVKSLDLTRLVIHMPENEIAIDELLSKEAEPVNNFETLFLLNLAKQ